jgi:hypothetical protein
MSRITIREECTLLKTIDHPEVDETTHLNQEMHREKQALIGMF